jgi:hypothetical protein
MNVRVRSLCLLMLAAALGASSSWAANLRGVELGDPCRNAAEVETRRGAVPKGDVGQMLARKLLLFEDVGAGGKHAEILYRCSGPNGSVLSHSIVVSIASEAPARAAYARAKARLEARLGTPSNDSEQLTLPQRMGFWRAHSQAFSAEEIVEWNNVPQERVSVALRKPRDARDWQVVTLDLPPAHAVSSDSPAPTRRWLAASILVAACSAAITAALLMIQPLDRFRWLIALATPLAVCCDARWTSDWNEAGILQNGSITIFAGFLIFGALVSFGVARLLRWQAAGQTFASRARSSTGKRLTLSGFVLVAVLLVAMKWIFRPDHAPSLLAGNLSVHWVAPLGLLAATVLVVAGTVRLLQDGAGDAIRIGRLIPGSGTLTDRALGLAGVLGCVAGVTLCVNVLAEAALAL